MSFERLHALLWRDLEPDAARVPRPPMLAHYTSITALERIVRSHELWWSNPLCMNDVDELRYGLGLGLRQLHQHEGLRRCCPGEAYATLLAACMDRHAAFEAQAADVYVFSTSEHGPEVGDDGLLSMWRGYGGDGAGVALVMDSGVLARGPAFAPSLRPVAYRTHAQSEAWMAQRLQALGDWIARYQPAPQAMAAVAGALFERVLAFALHTKHRGFAEEREWRAVVLYEPHSDARPNGPVPDYALSAHGIEPRLRLPCAHEGNPHAPGPPLAQLVRRVLLGPRLSDPLAVCAVRRMLQRHLPALAGQIGWSSTPYRAR